MVELLCGILEVEHAWFTLERCLVLLFFFKLFWERHPELRGRVRTLFERRQLRFLTTAFTTPDTLGIIELLHRWSQLMTSSFATS